jgi:uncharacterized membrane protein
MEIIKKFKFELIALLVFSGLSVLYYLDTGEVKIIGALFIAFILLSVFVGFCEKIITKYRSKSINKNT